MTASRINFADLAVPTQGAVLDYLFFNTRFLTLLNTMNEHADELDGYAVTQNTLVQTGLNRINSTLGPFLSLLQQASLNPFLVATSTGSNSLTAGQNIQFNITSAAANIFTPTPYLLALDNNDQTNYGILTLTSYNNTTYALATHCVYASKTLVSNSWTISCDSVTLPAMINLLSQAQTAANTCNSDLSTIQADMVTVNSVVNQIQSGPVTSVAGRTGVVTLGEADISGLTGDLAARPTQTSVTSQIAGLQTSSANLTALAGLALTANKLLMATGTAALTQLAITSFMQGQLNMATAAAALANLGGAGLASPVFTGTPTAPTPAANDNSQNIATTAFIAAALAALTINSTQITPVFNDQVGTSYTFQASDSDKMVTLTNAAAISATVPAGLPKGWNCLVYQGGAGQATFSGVVNRQSQFRTAGQNAIVSLLAVTASTVVLGGDTST